MPIDPSNPPHDPHAGEDVLRVLFWMLSVNVVLTLVVYVVMWWG